VNVNGAVGNATFVRTLTGSGGTGDQAKVLFGDITTGYDKVSEGFLSINVSGTPYWIRTWTGGAGAGCSSNLVGSFVTSGEFVSYGFLPIINNGQTKYLEVYTIDVLYVTGTLTPDATGTYQYDQALTTSYGYTVYARVDVAYLVIFLDGGPDWYITDAGFMDAWQNDTEGVLLGTYSPIGGYTGVATVAQI